MSESAARRIDWSTAEVRDGHLSVDLTGAAEKGWVKHFERVLAMLEHGGAGWGDVRVSKSSIRVVDVQEGAAEDLRHLLEGVLQQLNSDRAGDTDGRSLEGERSDAEPDRRAEADLRLLVEFRSFAGQG